MSGPRTPDLYYTLDYFERSEDPDLRRTTPFSVSVHIADTRVSQAYTRPQVVQRGRGPQFIYLEGHLWGVDLSERIAELIDRRVTAYRLFARTSREITRDQTDYELRSAISSVEFVSFQETQQALLEIELSLWELPEERPVVIHRARTERPVYANDVSIFVSEVNEMLLKQIDRFVAEAIEFLSTGEPQLGPLDRDVVEATEEADGEADGDETGVLLLPAIAESQNQPSYLIIMPDDQPNRRERFGRPAVLPEGTYSVVLGSGPEDQRMRIDDVEVVPRQQTVLEPIWAAMTVDVIDQDQQEVRVRYDVYDADTGSGFGGRVSRSESLISYQTVWILEPGRYKVVLNNRPFNTLRDFVTVNLTAGQSEQLTVVVSSPESGSRNLIGAGNVDIDDLGVQDAPLSVISAINGSLSFTADNEDGPDDFNTVYFLDSEVDTTLTYEIESFRYELENTVAVGFNAVRSNPLRVASDEFSLQNTVLYSFTDVYGLYARVDGNTTLFGNQVVLEEATNFIKKRDGQTVSSETGSEVIRLSPPFLPLTLQEGAGLNINAVRTGRVEVGLRGGIGATQTIRKDVYDAAGTESIDGATYQVYEYRSSNFDIGFEVSAFSTLLLPFDTSFTSTADVFFPVGVSDAITFQWENVVNVVLLDNVSVYYRFLLENAWTVAGQGYLIQDHGVFLRLNYLVR